MYQVTLKSAPHPMMWIFFVRVKLQSLNVHELNAHFPPVNSARCGRSSRSETKLKTLLMSRYLKQWLQGTEELKRKKETGLRRRQINSKDHFESQRTLVQSLRTHIKRQMCQAHSCSPTVGRWETETGRCLETHREAFLDYIQRSSSSVRDPALNKRWEGPEEQYLRLSSDLHIHIINTCARTHTFLMRKKENIDAHNSLLKVNTLIC